MNQAMQDKLDKNEAVDVSNCTCWQRRYYDISKIFLGRDAEVDYCDAKTGQWIWSIGRHKITGRIYASLDAAFYQNPDFDCVWLR